MKDNVFLHSSPDSKREARTFSASELMAKLSTLPPDMPVIGLWDDMGAPIDSIKLSRPNIYYDEAVVVLDVSNPWNLW